MNIALITNYWKNSNGGGVKNYVVNLVDALRSKGNDVNVLFREGDDPEQFQGRRNKLAFSISCYRQLCKKQPDVIYSQGTWYCLLPGVLYKRFHRCKLIHTFHSDPYKRLSLSAKRFFQCLLNSCDCVTFVSKRLQERVVEVDGLSFPRAAITYAGVRSREVPETEVRRFREQYGINENAIVLLAQAMTAHPLKAEGLKLLLSALPPLVEIYPNLLLVVTREGPYSDELRAFAREIGVGAKVIFTGNVENPFVPLEICDIYTHITLGDGLPLSLLEAMVMGKPIIATPIGGIPEVIVDGENGILVAPEVEQIAKMIDFLLRYREHAERMGKCAKETAEGEFTWEQAADRFVQCCEDRGDQKKRPRTMLSKFPDSHN
jgi:glycosyltransferase involved in cell wall biosynthesis